ncbi:hypothetical protein MRY87_08650 [bacterium]|nr:hypothetical protein [bacterium]
MADLSAPGPAASRQAPEDTTSLSWRTLHVGALALASFLPSCGRDTDESNISSDPSPITREVAGLGVSPQVLAALTRASDTFGVSISPESFEEAHFYPSNRAPRRAHLLIHVRIAHYGEDMSSSMMEQIDDLREAQFSAIEAVREGTGDSSFYVDGMTPPLAQELSNEFAQATRNGLITENSLEPAILQALMSRPLTRNPWIILAAMNRITLTGFEEPNALSRFKQMAEQPNVSDQEIIRGFNEREDQSLDLVLSRGQGRFRNVLLGAGHSMRGNLMRYNRDPSHHPYSLLVLTPRGVNSFYSQFTDFAKMDDAANGLE